MNRGALVWEATAQPNEPPPPVKIFFQKFLFESLKVQHGKNCSFMEKGKNNYDDADKEEENMINSTMDPTGNESLDGN